MRWWFIDPNYKREQADREAVIAKIDSWWNQFVQDCNDIAASFSRNYQGKFARRGELAEWMAKYLQPISESLMWEFGPAVNGAGHRLVITPESAHHVRPLTSVVLQRAPVVSGWEFYQYRLPESIEILHPTVNARMGVDSTDFKVRLRRGEHNRIDICYFSSVVTGGDDQNALQAAFVVTETLLGEEYLNKWVGNIDVSPLRKSFALASLFSRKTEEMKHLIALDRLKNTFDAIVQSIQDQLPPDSHQAWLNDDSPYNLVELKPNEADEYPERDDLFVAVTANVAMWSAAHSGLPFYSERFSRCGETFCYLKIWGGEGLDGCEFSDRGEIEDAVDGALEGANLGCVIGGGTGKMYSYSDLALTDVSRGIHAIKQRLRAGGVPKRTWIQFFDSYYTREWVGIYDETPPPPMRPLEV